MKIGNFGIKLINTGFVIDTKDRVLLLLWLKNWKLYYSFKY